MGNIGSNQGYYQDANGRWHRPNGQFASNDEIGIIQTTTNVTGKIHGNSLANPKTNYGYALVNKDTREILKFGETLYPNTRYSQKYLNSINAEMKIMITGSKYDVHMWQHQQILNYYDVNMELPPLNRSIW